MRIAAILLAFMILALPAAAAPKFPPLTGRVVDAAHILSPATVADLDRKLAGLQARTSRQLVVVTLPSLQGYDIADYGYQLGRAWGIGQAKLNNGALLIVAPKEHRVRIEVGYGLEPILTDALSEVIIQQAVLPKFRAGDFNGGVEAGADALIGQLSLNTSQAEARAAAALRQAQNGGGKMSGASPLSFLVVLLFIAIAFGRVFGGFGFWPLLFLGGLGGPRAYGGGYQGGGFGGFGGGGFGGGGFGGGGGSFGGGGASGSW
ncbi:MAG: TPM domain-containing protein [Rhizomicrobium sp.]